jgi:hypothetical protein
LSLLSENRKISLTQISVVFSSLKSDDKSEPLTEETEKNSKKKQKKGDKPSGDDSFVASIVDESFEKTDPNYFKTQTPESVTTTVTTTKETIIYKIIDGQKVPEDVTEVEFFKGVYQKPVDQDVFEKIGLDAPVLKDPKTMLEDFVKTDGDW